MLVQPVVAVEKKELLAPEHAGESLTHHGGGVSTHRRWRDRLVELIGFTMPVSKALFERLVHRQALAGMLWSKQYYYFDVDKWLQEHKAHPLLAPANRRAGRERPHCSSRPARRCG